MLMLSRPRTLALVASSLIASLAHAGPTGLLSMPVADILGHREADFGLDTRGFERRIDKGYEWGQHGQFGLFDRVELGYDLDFLGHIAGNAKALLYEREGSGAISAGIANLSNQRVTAVPYAVARADFKKFRLHAGVQHDERWQGMFGIDGEAPGLRNVTLICDCVTGPSSRVWGGANIRLPLPGFAVTLAAGVPFDHDQGVQHSVGVGYGLRF